MKRFLLHIAGFLVLFLLGLIVLDWGYTYTFKHAAPRNKLKYAMQMDETTYDAVF
ncbi:MAG: hypothetical protein HRT68_15825 [Flavobacteriaceae bacterium]|nr:hypothetical protein [Flavobacteriaceae bacterium]